MEKDNVLYWKNFSAEVTEDQAKLISNKIKNMILTHKYDALVVDNGDFKGDWSIDVDFIWIDLMAFVPMHVGKAVTICPDISNKLQLNYLSNQAGTSDIVKAFTNEEKTEIETFLEKKILG
jgi:hypothetical protein